MSLTKSIVIVAALSLCPYLAIGSTITSAISTGGTIEISGSGFGNTSPMYFWDDVNNSFLNQGALDNKVVQVGSNYTWKKNTNEYGLPFYFRAAQLLRNGKKGVVYYGEGHKNFLGEANFTTTASSKSMYVSWWYKPSEDPSGEGGSNKFIRIWDDPNGNGTRISWTQMHLTCNSESWADWSGTVGQWNRHEVYVDLASKKIDIRINGKLVHSMVGCEKNAAYANTPLFIEILGFDHGSDNYKSMTTMLDDIYIGENLRRIEIAESNDWNYEKKSEVLEIISWSDTKIVAKVPKDSSIHESTSSYIYYIDENDNKISKKLNCQTCPKL